MRKNLLKTFCLTAALAAGMTAQAQTDVTSQYIQNADFSQSTPIDNHLCGYGKDMAANGTTYYGMQDVTGWTLNVIQGDDSQVDYPNSGVAGAVFAYGSEWQLKGNQKTAPATSPEGGSGQALGFFAVWGCGGYYYQNVTLSAGGYTLTVPIYNQSGTQNNTSFIGFFPEDSETGFTVPVNPAVGQWTSQTVTFTLENTTSGQIRMGYKSNGSGSGANPMIFIDGIKIEYMSVDDANKKTWEDALQVAQDALANPDYANVGGEEKANLVSAIGNSSPSDYLAAAETLTAATQAYVAAKASYDAYAKAIASVIDLPYADPSKKPSVGSNAPLNADEAQTIADQINLELRAYYESHAKAEGIANVTDFTENLQNVVNPENISGWTDEGDAKIRINSGESYVTAEGEDGFKYFDSNNWGANSFEGKFYQTVTLPKGKYLLSAKARGYLDGTYQLYANDITTDIDLIGATGGVFGKGWNSYTVEFDLEEDTSAQVGIYVATSIVHSWVSFSDFRLIQLSNETTGITTVESTKQPANAIYTLAGQRVNNAQKGIYITNGKKVVMK